MSKLYSLLAINLVASGAILANRILAAVPGTDDTVTQGDAATLPRKLVGVSMNVDTGDGARLDAHVAGIVPVKYGGTVQFGDPLTSDATGRAVKAGPGEPVIGTAMETGAVNEIGSVKIGDEAGSRDVVITGTLVLGVCEVITGTPVTATTRAFPTPNAAITGSTNFGGLAHFIAENTVGAAGVGAVVIKALTATGVLDADAAGPFQAILKG